MRLRVWTILAAGLVAGGPILAANDGETLPNGKGHSPLNAPGNSGDAHNNRGKPGPPAPSTNITYHGGPVILGTTNVYYIWYGNWSGNSATTILTDLANNIGGSPYFNINTTYYNGSNLHV